MWSIDWDWKTSAYNNNVAYLTRKVLVVLRACLFGRSFHARSPFVPTLLPYLQVFNGLLISRFLLVYWKKTSRLRIELLLRPLQDDVHFLLLCVTSPLSFVHDAPWMFRVGSRTPQTEHHQISRRQHTHHISLKASSKREILHDLTTRGGALRAPACSSCRSRRHNYKLQRSLARSDDLTAMSRIPTMRAHRVS